MNLSHEILQKIVTDCATQCELQNQQIVTSYPDPIIINDADDEYPFACIWEDGLISIFYAPETKIQTLSDMRELQKYPEFVFAVRTAIAKISTKE